MTDTSKRYAACGVALVVVVTAIVGCDSAVEPSSLRLPGTAVTAKATGVTVTAANPSFGKQGQTNESVTITGTGFAPGAQASWLRNGSVDSTIAVTSTQFVSSTTLIATINISANSPVDYRDIQVMSSGRTQGIGSLLFEVTQAVAISGTSWVRSINDNGEATGTLAGGTGVFYYNISVGQLETVSPTGTGYDISTAGTAIVGAGGNGYPFLYTRTGAGGTWQATALPVDASTTSGVARAMATDAAGQVTQIGGIEYYSISRRTSATRSVTWIWNAATSTWQRLVLPGDGTEVRHRALSSNGVLGGIGPGGHVLGPAVWMPNGSGGYALTMLAPAGAVNGIRSDGGMLVGFTGVPVYWLAQPGGTWSAPVTVAGGCSGVKDVSDAGRFVLNDCPIGNGGAQRSPAYGDAPYSQLTRLGGLGPKNIPGFVSGISHGGQYAGGYAGSQGVYWLLP